MKSTEKNEDNSCCVSKETPVRVSRSIDEETGRCRDSVNHLCLGENGTNKVKESDNKKVKESENYNVEEEEEEEEDKTAEVLEKVHLEGSSEEQKEELEETEILVERDEVEREEAKLHYMDKEDQYRKQAEECREQAESKILEAQELEEQAWKKEQEADIAYENWVARADFNEEDYASTNYENYAEGYEDSYDYDDGGDCNSYYYD